MVSAGELLNTIHPARRVSIAQAARLMSVSPRSVARAGRILRDGVPELAALCKAGHVKLGAAELVSRLPPDEQRSALARGAAAVRQLAAALRRPAVRRCPHCGGPL